jgi:LysM repeat protein
MSANGIRRANHIRVGQVLEIPGGTRVAAAAPEPVRSVSAAPAAAGAKYRVRSGDTLGRIAKRHGVSERALADANGIRNKSLVKVGQVLRIPGAGAAAGGGSRGGVYTVRRGDTIDSIARKHGVAAQSIVALNGLANKHRIKAGQRLYLPED